MVKPNFLQLIQLYEAQALVSLGKFADPSTGKVNKNLSAAALQVAILELLQEKTVSNLTSDEEIYLSNALNHLRLNYVEVSKSADNSSSSESSGDDAATDPSSDTRAGNDGTGLVGLDGQPL